MYEVFEQPLQKFGVTPYKISKQTGVTQTTSSNRKNGKNTPSNSNLQKIADYFGVSGHTHASLLMEQVVDIDSISRRLGHADSRITREIYLHVTQKMKEWDNERIKEVKLI